MQASIVWRWPAAACGGLGFPPPRRRRQILAPLLISVWLLAVAGTVDHAQANLESLDICVHMPFPREGVEAVRHAAVAQLAKQHILQRNCSLMKSCR